MDFPFLFGTNGFSPHKAPIRLLDSGPLWGPLAGLKDIDCLINLVVWAIEPR